MPRGCYHKPVKPDVQVETGSPRGTKNKVMPTSDSAPKELVPFSPVDFNHTSTHHPSEIHQGAAHFILHPEVPLRWKLFYLLVSLSTVSLQIVALLGLLSDVDALEVDDILSLYKEMNPLDWTMGVLVSFLTAFSVYSEVRERGRAGELASSSAHDLLTRLVSRAGVRISTFPLLSPPVDLIRRCLKRGSLPYLSRCACGARCW